MASEPEHPGVADEAPVAGAARPGLDTRGTAAAPDDPADEARLRGVPSLLAAMPAGAEIGTLVHAVLEGVDFAAPDMGTALAAEVERQRTVRHVDVGEPASVVTGLRAALETPLGPAVGDIRLRDIAAGDRLDELAFELPLVGGDQPSGSLTLHALSAVLRRHLPAGDLLAGYPDLLADPSLATDLRGYLAGSIDLVLRVVADGVPGTDTGAGGAPAVRFVVVDHKTNWLGAAGEDLSAWHYRPAALTDAMQRAHYPLQALLYTVALHRYLRWRVRGYDAGRNLGGVLYLFLRGMSGAATPRVGDQPCGVFAWQPPATLVVALSDLFDHGVDGR